MLSWSPRAPLALGSLILADPPFLLLWLRQILPGLDGLHFSLTQRLHYIPRPLPPEPSHSPPFQDHPHQPSSIRAFSAQPPTQASPVLTLPMAHFASGSRSSFSTTGVFLLPPPLQVSCFPILTLNTSLLPCPGLMRHLRGRTGPHSSSRCATNQTWRQPMGRQIVASGLGCCVPAKCPSEPQFPPL